MTKIWTVTVIDLKERPANGGVTSFTRSYPTATHAVADILTDQPDLPFDPPDTFTDVQHEFFLATATADIFYYVTPIVIDAEPQPSVYPLSVIPVLQDHADLGGAPPSALDMVTAIFGGILSSAAVERIAQAYFIYTSYGPSDAQLNDWFHRWAEIYDVNIWPGE